MNNQTNIVDVLSGNAAVKVEVGVDYKSAGILAAAFFFALLGALMVYKYT
jgi:hypothetical protein